MLRVTLELVPFGTAAKPQLLGIATISNDISSNEQGANYNVTVSRPDNPQKLWRRGRVEGFQRSKQSSWDLLLLALRATLGSRESENVKTTFVPYVEEPEWSMAPSGYDYCAINPDGKAYWANEEPFVVAGLWTVQKEAGKTMIFAGFVDVPLGVDYRLLKYMRPNGKEKARLDSLKKFGRFR